MDNIEGGYFFIVVSLYNHDIRAEFKQPQRRWIYGYVNYGENKRKIEEIHFFHDIKFFPT